MTVLDLSRGACRGLSPALFIPAEGESPEERSVRETAALAVCRVCPVRLACREDAESTGYLRVSGGIAGGNVYEPDRRPECRMCGCRFERINKYGPVPTICRDRACHRRAATERVRQWKQSNPELRSAQQRRRERRAA